MTYIWCNGLNANMYPAECEYRAHVIRKTYDDNSRGIVVSQKYWLYPKVIHHFLNHIYAFIDFLMSI